MRALSLAFLAFFSTACVGDSGTPGPDASSDATADGGSDAQGTDASDATSDAAPDAPPTEAGGPTTVASNAVYRGILSDFNTYADHLFTLDESEFAKLGYMEDTPHPFFYFGKDPGPGGILHELDRCSDPGKSPIRHTLGIDKNCFEAGFNVDGPLGFVPIDLQTASKCGATQFVKLYRAQVDDRVFTNNEVEIANLEGSGYIEDSSFVAYAWTSPSITCYP